MSFILPLDHRPYTDKYFLRSRLILGAYELNPFVRYQVFIRDGPGILAGVNEALEILDRYGNVRAAGGRVYALSENGQYQAGDTVMVIEGRVQDLIELETMYLGVLTAETTRRSDGIEEVDLEAVTKRTSRICELAGERPVIYFGARHWRYDWDAAIAAAAFAGGAAGASTDIGAGRAGLDGAGTIPHALEAVFAAAIGDSSGAVRESTLAFDRVIEPEVPRVALIDYDNREIDDSLEIAALLPHLTAVWLDTPGENVAQGADATLAAVLADRNLAAAVTRAPDEEKAYWYGPGVTISALYALRTALDKAGFNGVAIMLSSGFGRVEKVRAFVNAEKVLRKRLFDSIGAGGLYPARIATSDIVAVAESIEELDRPENACGKVGRRYRPNPALRLMT